MSEHEKQINEMEMSLAMRFEDIAIAIIKGQYREALDIALKTKKELVDDCESNN